MKSIIIGTAGHVDHGKTALVKALTGIDADRLAEEKRRGITIDLGFAHLDMPAPGGEKLQVSFVDVPGHERFVRNMLAGAGGIDLVLLVIAADESIKPQTREHFEILQLLGVERGITVITKSDAIDAETLEVVRLEVADYLNGTFLDPARSPMIAVSSLTGAGLLELKAAIASVARNVTARDSAALARLPIDRVFTMKGFGTVVTGTLISGTIRREDELEVFPSGRRLRVRGIQVHGHDADKALAGQRTALNLAGAATDDLSRGMMLAPAGAFSASRRVDVQLSLLPSAPRALKNRSRVHFHVHSMELVAEVTLHGARQIDPAESAFARLKLPESVLLLPGDRFIIRQFSPVVTVGGGIVLDAMPMPRRADAASFLAIAVETDHAAILRARIARRGRNGISVAALIAETGQSRESLQCALAPMVQNTQVRRVQDFVLDAAVAAALEGDTLTSLENFHRENPMATGEGREQLRQQLRAPVEIFSATLDTLVAAGKVEVAGDLVRLTGRGAVLKEDEAESKSNIENAFAFAGLKVPALDEVLRTLKIDKVRAQRIVTLLLRDKLLVKVSNDLVFHRSSLDELRRQITAYKAKSPSIDVAAFKELTGVSRKYAIPLLEYLDRERVTRRVGEVREIL